MDPLREPADDDWVAITDHELPLGRLVAWAGLPSCGAVVTFSGTVRDSSEGRPGVVSLEYEAFETAAEARLGEVAACARGRWPTLARLALLHRVGMLSVGETSVVAVVSSPHREQAFAAARYCIDTLKRTVPIWKKETWEGGHGWSEHAQAIEPVDPAPVDPAPVDPAPVDPAPVDPAPVDPAR